MITADEMGRKLDDKEQEFVKEMEGAARNAGMSLEEQIGGVKAYLKMLEGHEKKAKLDKRELAKE